MSIQRLRDLLEAYRAAIRLPAGWVYRGAPDFVLQHGQEYPPRPLDKTTYLSWRRGLVTLAQLASTPKLCFANAIINAELYSWRYVEGYALEPQGFIPIAHAWNEDLDGNLVDATWKNAGRAYLGVPFSLGRADDATWNGDSSILDDFRRGHPLFREAWPGEDWSKVWEPTEALLLVRKRKKRS